MLINKAKVREVALTLSRDLRNGKFTRVGNSFFNRLDRRLAELIENEVRRHPSLGVTLK